MGPVSIGVEVQRNTDGDTPSNKNHSLEFQHIKAHIYCSYQSFNNVYLSISISSLVHLLIFEAPTFHFIKTLKDYYLWVFYDYIMMDWS